MKKRKGFTLIEVIAVLVILAMIFLIVTPLVMNIIRKAKDSADKRSIDIYGRTVEIATVAYMLDDTQFPTSFDDLTIEYTGSKVECAVNIVNYDGSVFLDKCAVNGRLIKDSKYRYYGSYENWETILDNLLSNFMRYAKTKIKITLRQNKLILYNDGEGIDKDFLEVIFTPFRKGIKGEFGLGLSIVKKTLNMMNYDITIRNEKKGVSFIITKYKGTK